MFCEICRNMAATHTVVAIIAVYEFDAHWVFEVICEFGHENTINVGKADVAIP